MNTRHSTKRKPRAVAWNFRAGGNDTAQTGHMRGDRSTTFTDGAGRRWRVREIIRPDGAATVRLGRIPALTHATLIFESRGERRFVSDAPLDWRDDRQLLGDMFARARRRAVTRGGMAAEPGLGMSDAEGGTGAILRPDPARPTDTDHG